MSASKASVAVLISGILAILGSAFNILIVAFTLAALYLVPFPPTVPTMPSYVRSIAAFGLLFFLVLSVFGIFTGVGLIRLKNWARISILVFSGFTVFFGGIALLVLMAIPFPTNPTGPPVEPGAVKAVVLMVYGIPVLIGIWWLVLFSLKATRAQFAGAPSQTSPEISPVPSCPLPVQIIAVLYLFSLLPAIFIPLIHTPFHESSFRARGAAGLAVSPGRTFPRANVFRNCAL